MITKEIVESYGGEWHGWSNPHNGVAFEFNGKKCIADPEDVVYGFIFACFDKELQEWLKSQ